MGFPSGPSSLQIGQFESDKGGFASPGLTGEIENGPSSLQGLTLMSPGMSGGFNGMSSADPNDPVERLRHLIQDRREETVEVLRTWMEDPEEST
jgi:flagellar M-ring protein FliF